MRTLIGTVREKLTISMSCLTGFPTRRIHNIQTNGENVGDPNFSQYWAQTGLNGAISADENVNTPAATLAAECIDRNVHERSQAAFQDSLLSPMWPNDEYPSLNEFPYLVDHEIDDQEILDSSPLPLSTAGEASDMNGLRDLFDSQTADLKYWGGELDLHLPQSLDADLESNFNFESVQDRLDHEKTPEQKVPDPITARVELGRSEVYSISSDTRWFLAFLQGTCSERKEDCITLADSAGGYAKKLILTFCLSELLTSSLFASQYPVQLRTMARRAQKQCEQ